MISVIVSSHRADDFSRFRDSLGETIGAHYELIKVENQNEFSLSAAYNIGAKQARYDILLFVHEDVAFETPAWGLTLTGLFSENEDLGIVGVAGALEKSGLPTGWGTGIAEFDRINLIQPSDQGEKHHSTRKVNELTEPVKVMDGVFLATRKRIWEEVQFDESLVGYHLYDIDFSLRVTQRYRGLISYEILLKHFSMGNYNSDWVEATLAYHRKSEKQGLFDKDMSYASGIRRAWYKALTFGNISSELRTDYLAKIGVDPLSMIHAFAFRFPVFGKKIFKILSLAGL